MTLTESFLALAKPEDEILLANEFLTVANALGVTSRVGLGALLRLIALQIDDLPTAELRMHFLEELPQLVALYRIRGKENADE